MTRSSRCTRWCLAALALLAWQATPASADPIYSSIVLGDAPVGYWRLGETPAQMMAFDASPFARHGTYMGGVLRGIFGAIRDDPNTAARFDGATGFVAIAGGPFNFANNFTLEAWVINDSTSGIRRIFSNGQPAQLGYGFGILADGRLRFTTYGIRDYDSQVVVPRDGMFHHVVATFDSNNAASFYLDGAFRETIAGPLPARSSPFDLQLGHNPAGPPEFWNGVIDEAAIYNRVLTSGQIADHFAAGVGAVPEPSSLTLLGVAALALLGYAGRRRRRVAHETPE